MTHKHLLTIAQEISGALVTMCRVNREDVGLSPNTLTIVQHALVPVRGQFTRFGQFVAFPTLDNSRAAHLGPGAWPLGRSMAHKPPSNTSG